MSRQARARTTESRVGPWITAFVVMVGVALSFVLFTLTQNTVERRIDAQFEAQAIGRLTSVEQKLHAGNQALAALAAYRGSGASWDAGTFGLLATPYLEPSSGILALEWVTRVRGADRARFEQSMRIEGSPYYVITERDEKGKLVPAAAREDYFPVAIVAPLKGNEAALGYDVASDAVRRSALMTARDGGYPAATAPVRLIQGTGERFGTLVFWPLYQHGSSAGTFETRRQYLEGFILAVYDVARLAEAALEPFALQRGIHVTLRAASESGAVLYSNAPEGASRPPPSAGNGRAHKRLFLAASVPVGDRHWRIEIAGTPEFERQVGDASPWFVLAGCLGVTLFAALLVQGLVARSRALRGIVQKRTAELERSHGALRAVLDTVVDGIITIDETGVIRSVNPSAEHIFGYAESELIGRNVSMLMPKPFASEHDGYLRTYAQTGIPRLIGIGRETTGLRKNGSTFPLDLAVGETRFGEERLFTGIVRDITDRKRAERELFDAGAMRQAILDGADYSIISTDVEGVIRTFNRGAQRMLGYTEAEVVGKVTPALIHDPVEFVPRANVLSLELGKPIKPGFGVFVAKARLGLADQNEWTYIRKDGSRFPVLLSVTALRDPDGKITGYLGIGADITERKKIERLKDEFVSTVSHELRTPLTSIRGSLGIVLSRAGSLLPSKLVRMLEIASRNSERLSLLINDILDLEKLESGRIQLEQGPIDLTELLHEARDANEGFAKQHGVNLAVSPVSEPGHVWGDSHRLLQVCANLISNAVKFSPRGATVEIAATARASAMRVTVSDRGPGIPESFRARIFQRFAQADTTDSRDKGGTGLGLSIAKAIVERHDGKIGFESRDGGGTVFYFDLPVWKDTSRREVKRSEGPRVLICEDNRDVAQILAELVESQELASDIAGTAAAARKLLAAERYAMLLLDLSLPDADGLSLLRELRDDEKTRCLPVVVVSGRAEEGKHELNGDMLRVVDWIPKPVDEARLGRALTNALAGIARPSILHVEDDPDVVQVVKAVLGDLASCEHAVSVSGARQMLHEKRYDLVLLDLKLKDGEGVDLLSEFGCDCPVVIFSGEMPSRVVSDQVVAALAKSTTSNDELLAVIKEALAA